MAKSEQSTIAVTLKVPTTYINNMAQKIVNALSDLWFDDACSVDNLCASEFRRQYPRHKQEVSQHTDNYAKVEKAFEPALRKVWKTARKNPVLVAKMIEMLKTEMVIGYHTSRSRHMDEYAFMYKHLSLKKYDQVMNIVEHYVKDAVAQAWQALPKKVTKAYTKK